MDERSSTRKPRDLTALAAMLVAEATGESLGDGAEISAELSSELRHAAAVALGRRGGQKGGKARAARLTAEERQTIARRAAQARWHPEEHSE